MKLVHPILKQPLDFLECYSNILVVENRVELTRLIQELLEQSEKGIGNFVLSENDKVIDIRKGLMLFTNPFDMDFNQRKIMNGIQSLLKKTTQDEVLYFETKELLIQIEQYFDKLIDLVEYPIEFPEVEVDGLIKYMSPTIESEWENILEKVVDFLGVAKSLLDIKCFVFVNFHLFFSKEEIDLLFQTIKYKKYDVLFLETICPEKRDDVRITILDNDLCDIVY